MKKRIMALLMAAVMILTGAYFMPETANAEDVITGNEVIKY